MSVGLVDDVQISYCDSRTNENVPKQEWMNKVSSEYPNYWKEETQTCREKQQTFKVNLKTAKLLFNHTEGVPIFQQMYGCECDDHGMPEVKGYDRFGFDGKDLIILDLKTQSWITPKPKASITKRKWDDGNVVHDENVYLTQICVDWLKKYLSYGQSYLMKTDLPSVSLLQKTPSSPISCHATGFYPNTAEMFWWKDGKEIRDGVVKGEILPNNDGTFQMTVDIDLSSETSDNWMKYECVFQLSGLEVDIVTRLQEKKIKTNKANSTFIFIIVLVAILLFILMSVIGWLRRNGTPINDQNNGQTFWTRLNSRSFEEENTPRY